ncbi:hypothetical protein BDP81DRAFT_19313 [Colletotrichum phormii]|uniref:C2H2-type domain-containing protein n=1 Tax=Colletotrichum phormii TaxID=359342 RepID=A0AAJ0A4F6_9PEZI|nr:uncharacterized protein BDP81DRAFT_19313 [Colletotrichum phormii]KAK1656293.1 hypothetical protein BDP81DRAFT_19313 [Colletotrichum phormii]
MIFSMRDPMWTPTGTVFDPTARLTQQLEHLAIYEQPVPAAYAPQQAAAALYPAQTPAPVSQNPNYGSTAYAPQYRPSVWSTSNIGVCPSPLDYPPHISSQPAPTWVPDQVCTAGGYQDGSNSPFIPGYSLIETTRGTDSYRGGARKDSFIDSAKPLLLACPYLKYDPSTYSQRRGCRGAAFPSTHRLKEHLHRTHRQKPNCPRCRSLFKTEAEVGNHLKAQALCKVILGDGDVEGFDAAQEKLLKSKKRRKGVDTEEDKWREIFKILFPGHQDVPDPFYKTSLDDQSLVIHVPIKDQDDVESIFTRDIPSPVEEETFSKMEEAVGGRLTKKKRRKLMNVFRGFAVKMLRHSAEGDNTDRAITAMSKSSQVERPRSARAPGEELQRVKADEKPNEKLERKQDEVYVVHEATQTSMSGPPMDPVMTLSSFPSVEGTMPRSAPLDFQAFDLGIDSDVAFWPAWDAAFANDNEDAWLDDLLRTVTALPGGFAQEQDKTVGIEPANAYDCVETIPRQTRLVIGRDATS